MRLGVFGGAFDPPTLGHLRTAQVLAERGQLDKVLFVPSPDGRSDKHPRAHAPHRLEMCRRAIAGNSRFGLDDGELRMAGEVCTVRTLEHLTRRHPDDEVFMLLGSDLPPQLHRWHDADNLRHYRFLLAARPGYGDNERLLHTDPWLATWNWQIELVADPSLLPLSSTLVRDLLRQGRQVRYLVPEAVLDYITEHGLYTEEAQR